MLTHKKNHSLSSLLIKNGLHLLKLLIQLDDACLPILYLKERINKKGSLILIYRLKACELKLVRIDGLQA